MLLDAFAKRRLSNLSTRLVVILFILLISNIIDVVELERRVILILLLPCMLFVLFDLD